MNVMAFWLYLYSTRNIVACLLALLAPLLLFMGVIHDYWLAITVGLYALGYAIVPATAVNIDIPHETLSFEALLKTLEQLLQQKNSHLPPEAVQHLQRICQSIQEVLPRLHEQSIVDDNVFTIRQTLSQYLPETLHSYLALPAAFRVSHALQNGKTAKVLLVEQLSLLDEQIQQVVVNIAKGDAQALLANGRFLEQKFKERSFLVVR